MKHSRLKIRKIYVDPTLSKQFVVSSRRSHNRSRTQYNK